MARQRGSTPGWRLGAVRLPSGLGPVLFVLLIPFVALGLLVLAANLYGLVRYDPAYFSTRYLEEYGEASQVVRDLELALQTGNRSLLAELQGLRWPRQFPTSDTISFVKLWQRAGRYVTYLYVDMDSYERHAHHLEKVRGRWVVAPEDVRYFLYSGQWRAFFLPAAITWWVLGLAVLTFLWLLRHSASLRSRFLGR
jgi:hypothetical protein